MVYKKACEIKFVQLKKAGWYTDLKEYQSNPPKKVSKKATTTTLCVIILNCMVDKLEI
jgi:hypothetical protein